METEDLCGAVAELCKKVGEFIRRESISFDQARIEYKGLHDMVSYVDKTAEEMLVKGLADILPEAGFITEEKTVNKVSDDYNWIIDPLDGTTNFIHGIPAYCISIALQFRSELILGVVYEISRDECFYAWKDGGAYLNGKPIRVSEAAKLEHCLLATGFPFYDFEKMEAYIQVFRDLIQRCQGLRRIGSAALDLAYTAAGRFDAYFEYNLHVWDAAAGIVLVREAGGQVCDFSGEDEMLGRRELIATNGRITPEIFGIINRHFYKTRESNLKP